MTIAKYSTLEIYLLKADISNKLESINLYSIKISDTITRFQVLFENRHTTSERHNMQLLKSVETSIYKSFAQVWIKIV